MSGICECGSPLRTLGSPNCAVTIGRGYMDVFVNTYNADGTLYELDLS